MALTLLLVFRVRRRLLPLALALAAAALTFGAMSVAGASLTDRLDRRAAGAGRARGRLRDPVPGAVPGGGVATEAAARAGGPVIATAGAATAAGFLVLLLSPVPMVRGFGALLVVGIVIAFARDADCGIRRAGRRPATSLPAGFRGIRRPRRGRVLSRRIPSRFGRLTGRARAVPPARWAASFLKFVRDGTRGLIAEAKLVPPLVKRWGRWAFGVSVARPGRVLRIASAARRDWVDCRDSG